MNKCLACEGTFDSAFLRDRNAGRPGEIFTPFCLTCLQLPEDRRWVPETAAELRTRLCAALSDLDRQKRQMNSLKAGWRILASLGHADTEVSA